jgi:ribosomal protein S18 acetylase RimI-like enzyme
MPNSREVGVRKATVEDLPRVASLFQEVLAGIPYYNRLAKQNESKKWSLRTLRTKLRDDAYSILVAHDEHGILGFAFTRFDDYLIWIEWFGVDPKSRRDGVGSALIQELVRTASMRNAHKVWCDTRSNNVPAKSTFRKNGFRELVELKDHWYGEDYILWERSLRKCLSRGPVRTKRLMSALRPCTRGPS